MQYTAKLTGNKRDINTTSPKALLISINPDSDLTRDHCWVTITPELGLIQPKGHQKPIVIQFNAELKKYVKRGTQQATTLHKLTNITRI